MKSGRTDRMIKWLADSMSCKRFARQVASGVESLPGGFRARFDFWIHWIICPYCRKYWEEMKTLGEVHRAAAALQNHPAVKISDIKKRLKEKLVRRTG